MTTRFQGLLARLRQGSAPLSADQVATLSDLSPVERQVFLAAWSDLPQERRLRLLEHMGRLADERIELNFDAIDRAALTDPDPHVRSVAIRNLWECEDPALADCLLQILHTDPALEPVRAAARALGHFVLLAEPAQLEEGQLERIVAGLLSVAVTSPDDTARRTCVESLGYSSRSEAAGLIQQAFESDQDAWRASALIAMGRSANDEWAERILPMLQHPAPTLRLEAARACGELELKASTRPLVELLQDPSPEIRRAAVWSLGQVGGKPAYQALRHYLRRNDYPEDAELIDSALENLAFVEGTEQMLGYSREDDDLEDEGDEA